MSTAPTPSEAPQTSLRLYDSAARAVVPLAPTVTPGEVTVYLCGATVQGSPHIGHMRSAIVFDVLRRWLERQGQRVTLIRNVTDIDDKILTRSAAAEPPWPWWAWAQHHERQFDAAYRALGVAAPTYEPRATGHLPEMISLVTRLLERGHAYVGEAGNVYFSVASLPGYGSLTNQRPEDLVSAEEDPGETDEADKRDPRDFALWKTTKPGEPADAAWDAPWGRGRPGWHLECSAMSHRYLGEEFDIHGGGIDLRFPHHENEQAQSHGAGWGFARHWVHNAWVTVKGAKMSKSLGNSLTVAELLRAHDPAVLRLALGTVHYRSTVEFSEETLAEAANLWERLNSALTRASEICPDLKEVTPAQLADLPLPEAFGAAMDDDLNLAGAMAQIHVVLKQLNSRLSTQPVTGAGEDALSLRAMLSVLGLDPFSEPWRAHTQGSTGAAGDAEATVRALDQLVTSLLAQRAQARAAKDWSTADSLRDALAAAGVVVEDSPNGARWRLA